MKTHPISRMISRELPINYPTQPIKTRWSSKTNLFSLIKSFELCILWLFSKNLNLAHQKNDLFIAMGSSHWFSLQMTSILNDNEHTMLAQSRKVFSLHTLLDNTCWPKPKPLNSVRYTNERAYVVETLSWIGSKWYFNTLNSRSY